jgi:tryptophanyl-tRNA synthetase
MERELGPIRERRKALELEKQTVYTTIEEGAAACREIAAATMIDVRSAIGVRQASGIPSL